MKEKICILVIRSPQKWNKPTTGVILGSHPASSSMDPSCCLSGGKEPRRRLLWSLNIEVRAQMHCAAKNLFQMSSCAHSRVCWRVDWRRHCPFSCYGFSFSNTLLSEHETFNTWYSLCNAASPSRSAILSHFYLRVKLLMWFAWRCDLVHIHAPDLDLLVY